MVRVASIAVLLFLSAIVPTLRAEEAAESTVLPADRVTHYRACEHLNAQCVAAITFPEGTQSYYFRWKQCDQQQKECLKHPVPASAIAALAARATNKAAEAEVRKAEKEAAAALARAEREGRVFPELASASEIAEYNARVAPQDQLICRPQPVTGSHRSVNLCRTRREIQELTERTQEEMRRHTLKSEGSPTRN